DLLARHPWLRGRENLSLLHLQILHGLLRVSRPTSGGFCYLRRPNFLAEMPEDRRPDFAETLPRADLLDRLEQAIRMSGRAVREYACRWDQTEGTIAGLDTFRGRVLADLSGAIAELLEERARAEAEVITPVIQGFPDITESTQGGIRSPEHFDEVSHRLRALAERLPALARHIRSKEAHDTLGQLTSAVEKISGQLEGQRQHVEEARTAQT